ncbi:MAG: hypothetical protein CML47_05975 [Rhodobacteraceae bacterium]|nr:MAG: hypothetical protein CML47_05975 [Paracoccaceae bacterium]
MASIAPSRQLHVVILSSYPYLRAALWTLTDLYQMIKQFKSDELENNPLCRDVLRVHRTWLVRVVHRYREATEGRAREKAEEAAMKFVQEVVVPITEKKTLVEKAIKEEKPRMMMSLVERAAENVTSNAEQRTQTNPVTGVEIHVYMIGSSRNVVNEAIRLTENTNPWHRGPLATYYDLSASCRTMIQEQNPASRQFYEKHGKERKYKNEDMMFFCPELFHQNKKNNFKKLYSYGKDKETEKHIDQFPNRQNNVWWYGPDIYKLIYEKEIDGETYKCLDWDGETCVLPNLY